VPEAGGGGLPKGKRQDSSMRVFISNSGRKKKKKERKKENIDKGK
jgi:hypothetical protein